ncbi:MAG: UDP-N-acetylmuramate--L-alanine ligase, partial [Planctomycetota bacterium]
MTTASARPATMHAVTDDWLAPAHPADPNARLDLAGRRLHFIGVGGSGMSGLARLAASLGAACTGVDHLESPTTAAARDAGVAVSLDQSAQALPDALDAVIASAAVKPDHPQHAAATQRGVPVLKYADMLGRLMLGRAGVAIAGTHGKSSTTAMLAHVLLAAGRDPSFILGATCAQIGGSARVGDDPTLLAEACEYDRSFHHLHPTHAVVLNVEADHLDYYADLDEIVAAFAAFADRLPAHGSLLIQHECVHRLDIAGRTPAPVATLGFAPQADYRVAVDNGHAHLTHRKHGHLMTFARPLPGEHMAYNAAAAAITAHTLGVDWPDIADALSTFKGLDRRMQTLGSRNGVTVVDDYGHHPTEIDATLRALRQHHRPDKLVCVFQPHQHSRTRFLLDAFAASFADADHVLIPDIYFVRDSEAERRSVSAQDLVDRLTARNHDARHLPDPAD